MTVERWLPVVGYEDRYEVSDHGRVRSRVRTNRHKRPDTVLTPWRTVGYPTVGLYSGERSASGKPICRKELIHSLVLTAFVGPRPSSDFECCHKDDDKTNNLLSNLRWDTSLGNKDDMRRNGRHGNTKKVRCKRGHLLAAPNLHPYPSKPHFRLCLSCRRAIKLADYHRRTGKPPLDVDAYADEQYREIMGEEPVRAALPPASPQPAVR